MYIINPNLKFRGLSYGNNPKMIILHHAEASGCSIKDIHLWHLNNGWSGCGYNYFIKKDGAIYKGRPDNAIGAHCLSYNGVSIGICMEGRFNVEEMGADQYNSLKDLTCYLQNKYNINKIYGHRELNETECPGNNFPLHRIKKECLGGNNSIENSSNNKGSKSYPGYLLKYNPGRFDANVKLIQSKLQNIGYSVGKYGVDGYFGDGTLLAVKCFQRDCNLMIDGIIGVDTWKRIMRE
ncbi:N-acetylmuramoyl-L-alanine amidase [Clostridium botulinum]|uniref:peptidoglycan recognition protein family protein n=1 Tax=Clostridium botulinum TaxID=1491 RepID=UPI0001591FCF|nr:N-acetylmuramoyl-L-alanine amidase [Clostridium botulinum]ABS32372.1 N-acetylmuramoyl-L-alanine amidase [Clostridium botulinum A str. ATCC 19397]ABS36863.1 N-acetylmuramoyl-L-alanine amidase [Clostridium botulinum A str. Hall]AWB18662.1 N-acetylmuramoyl-L-alanine amidase [Clostridium botulinum]EGT5616583.1 N-acetylmuramoyl-L-alanine amidase [Clostridium botulinum]EGT5621153.1 N-acetylmuramoyl-L-alanine amidase [Clostridium botulinum]